MYLENPSIYVIIFALTSSNQYYIIALRGDMMDVKKEEIIKGLIDSLKDIKYIMPDDIPDIDLYMDQVTTFMDSHLKSSKDIRKINS